jgi:hypothetical protein
MLPSSDPEFLRKLGLIDFQGSSSLSAIRLPSESSVEIATGFPPVMPTFVTTAGSVTIEPALSASIPIPIHGVKMTDPTREEIAAQIRASEAVTETKIVRMEGKLDLVVAKIDGLREDNRGLREDNRATRANQWVIGLGLAVLIVAIAALVPVFFDLGTKISDIVDKAIQARVAPSAPALPKKGQ